jgi:hypothetical protein
LFPADINRFVPGALSTQTLASDLVQKKKIHEIKKPPAAIPKWNFRWRFLSLQT